MVISALLVNAVGIIGFIGLFAPLLAKNAGGAAFVATVMLALLIGALVLWLSDQIILWLDSRVDGSVHRFGHCVDRCAATVAAAAFTEH
ncbi:iron chelate uptake ABC transporter family permease subunit [Escherichia coli]